MFNLESGLKLGLWARHDVEPQAEGAGGGELCFPVGDDAALEGAHAAWSANGVPIVQPITEMDFGRTFVGVDPDGHRLRVVRPARMAARS